MILNHNNIPPNSKQNLKIYIQVPHLFCNKIRFAAISWIFGTIWSCTCGLLNAYMRGRENLHPIVTKSRKQSIK